MMSVAAGSGAGLALVLTLAAGAALAGARAAAPAGTGSFLRKPDRMLPKMSGLCPWLRMIRYCWVKVMMLLEIQYTTSPLAKPPSMNMNTQGIHENTCCCTGSLGAGFSFCCSHMVMPRMIGSRPMKIRCKSDPVAGAAQGNSPNRLYSDEVSGADRSFSQPKNGAWRSSMVTKITL